MQIKLNEAEQRLAKFLARKRMQQARKQNSHVGPIAGDSQEQIDLDGMGAEIAFAKMFNVYPDLDYLEPKQADFYTREGFTVDVKTTRYRGGRLMVKPLHQSERCDVYGLMVGSFPIYEFVGTATKEELFKSENFKRDLPRPAYVMEQSQLK